MRNVAIIQARMGSTRLPGKVLKEVNGKPLLWFLVERLKRCRKLNEIVVATTHSDQDDAVAEFCRDHQIKCFRGSEEDVLDRYYRCALGHQADLVVRITADCPLVDGNVVDKFIEVAFEHPEYDLLYTGSSYPEGLDVVVIPFASLETAWQKATLKSEREHVTPFIWKNTQLFNVQVFELKSDYSLLRLTVDEELDFLVVGEVLNKLIQSVGIGFTLEDIIRLYEHHPDLFQKNKNIIRNEGYLKSLEEDLRLKGGVPQ